MTGRGVQLSVDRMLERAQMQASLTDFGDPWFMGPLSHLIKLVNEGGGLKAEDCWPVNLMTGYLADRLRMVDYVKRHPEIHNEKLDVAGVIIGLPRGGSTLLQRLVGTSPQLTATKIWEMRFPIPNPDENPSDPSARIAKTQKTIDDMYAAWPDMKSMHPMTPTSYDEEILFIDRSFLCLNYAHYFNIPSYDQWDPAQDHTKAYEELALWLKILQHNAPDRRGKRWFLKSPHHLLGAHLRPMLKAFPGAKAVMTHRTLESVLASYCSLQATTIRNYSNSFDESKSGAKVIRLFKEALQNMVQVRKEYPADRFIDVQYNDVIAKPLDEFRRTMELMGLTVTAEDEKAASAWMSQNGRDSHPRHKYKPEDYGMSTATLNETFKFYREAFLKS